MKPTNIRGKETSNSTIREQNGQEFRRAKPDEINVGQCIWVNAVSYTHLTLPTNREV